MEAKPIDPSAAWQKMIRGSASRGGTPSRGLAFRRGSAMRLRTARLVLLLLVGGADWAAGGSHGHAQSLDPRTAAVETTTDFSWRLPTWMPPPPVPPDNPMSVAKVELGRSLFFDARLAGL